MPLTRHLYEMDEVESALQLSLLKGWPQSAFWTWELVVSLEANRARLHLLTAWLRYGGGLDPTVLTLGDSVSKMMLMYERVMRSIQVAGSLNAERLLKLSSIMGARQLVTPLPATREIQARRLTRSSAFVKALDPLESLCKEEAVKWWISLDSAIRQHNRRDALWLLQAVQPHLSVNGIWEGLTRMVRGSDGITGVGVRAVATEAKLHLQPEIQLLFQTAVVLYLCYSTEEREAYRPPTICSWVPPVEGRRSARLHAIPREALHPETTRGQTPGRYTNISHLRDPDVSDGCQFWQKALLSTGAVMDEEDNVLSFPDDDALERFYDQYFPDDIPDEWSRVDQEKSHGRGCAEKAPPPSMPGLVYRDVDNLVSGVAWKCGIHVR
jgi:hypothetical protein